MIYDKVVAILSEALNVDSADIQVDSKLKEDLGAESIDMLEIVFRLEEAFGIKIKGEELLPHGGGTFTVGDIMRYVEHAKS